MSSARWALRKSVQEARETLIELRVHASSPSVMTPYGQAVRTQLLQRLHALVHHLDANAPPGSPIGPFNVGLLNAEKGRKLLAELLPLWPPPVVGSTLLSFLQQLPLCLAGQADLDDQKLADVPQLAASLASLPKLLAPEQSAALLEATIAHGEATLAAARRNRARRGGNDRHGLQGTCPARERWLRPRQSLRNPPARSERPFIFP
jgi:hypothetical protein